MHKFRSHFQSMPTTAAEDGNSSKLAAVWIEGLSVRVRRRAVYQDDERLLWGTSPAMPTYWNLPVGRCSGPYLLSKFCKRDHNFGHLLFQVACCLRLLNYHQALAALNPLSPRLVPASSFEATRPRA